MLILTITLLLVPRAVAVRDFAEHGLPTGVEVRPCKITAASPKPPKETTKNKRKDVPDTAAAPVNACLEVHSTALDIQEYLQAYAREQKWNVADERVAEDVWSFARNLESKELLSETKSNSSNSRVNWTSGKAFVQVRTEELEGGFTRVHIFASFLGYGKNSDQFAPAKESWPLDSNGTLESQLISALEIHFRGLHRD